jgi:hypothetical protein
MVGTILNAGGILIGGVAGLVTRRQFRPKTQYALKGLLGVFFVFVGLKLTWTSLGGGLGSVARQLLIVLLALTLGRLTGRALRLQKSLNRFGQYAKAGLARASAEHRPTWSEAFLTASVLFCLVPLAILGALLDGLSGHWQTLGLKAVLDGLTMLALMPTLGRGALLAVIPVVAYQGTFTLLAQWAAPFLRERALLDPLNATGGLLVFCVALIILELRRIELADYLPSLAFAPLLAWLWR